MDMYDKRGICATVLRASSRFELGRNAAVASGARVRWAVRLLSRWARRHPERMETLAGAPRDRGTTPGSEELDGLALGLSMHPDDLMRARAFMESLAAPNCTNFGAVPPATPGDDVMVSWNFDASSILKVLMGGFPLYIREVEGTIPCVCLGVPALFGIGVLNAEGLCCVVNAVAMTDDGDGLSPFELNNLAMETCSSVDDAARLFADGPRRATWSMTLGMLMNWNTIWADRSGGMAVFEYSHNHFHSEPVGPGGVLASANHHQFLDRSLSGSVDPGDQEMIAGSYCRLARMWALLSEHHGRIDPVAARAITSDHVPDYSPLRRFGIERRWWEEMIDDSTICAHPWNLRRHLMRGEIAAALLEASVSVTLYSLQVQPRSFVIWHTNGNPCRAQATPTYWGKLLGAAGASYPGGLPVADRASIRVQERRRGMFREGMGFLESQLTRGWCHLVELVERANLSKVKTRRP